MQENELKAKIKELQLKFGKVEVSTRSMQALVDGENYAGVSQTLPVLLQELGDFQEELNALVKEEAPKIKKPAIKKVKAKPKPEPAEDPVEEEEEDAEE